MNNKSYVGFFQHDINQAAQVNKMANKKPDEQKPAKWGIVIQLYEKAPAVKLAKVIPMGW